MKILKSIFRGLFSEEISSLQKQIQSKQSALAEKETTISEIRREKQQLVSQIDTCHREISKLENQANMLEGTISSKDSELSAKNQRILVLESSLSAKQSESESDKELIKECRRQIESIEFAKNELEKLIENQNKLIKDNGTRSQHIEENLRIAREQVENLFSQKLALEIKIQELTHQLTEIQSISAGTETELSEKLNCIRAGKVDTD